MRSSIQSYREFKKEKSFVLLRSLVVPLVSGNTVRSVLLGRQASEYYCTSFTDLLKRYFLNRRTALSLTFGVGPLPCKRIFTFPDFPNEESRVPFRPE